MSKDQIEWVRAWPDNVDRFEEVRKEWRKTRRSSFKLIHKDYKTETYSAKFRTASEIIVRMWYHTHLKYWSVGVMFGYPPYNRTPWVIGKDYIQSRKEARKLAQEYMSIDPNNLFNKLDDFQKNLMLPFI